MKFYFILMGLLLTISCQGNTSPLIKGYSPKIYPKTSVCQLPSAPMAIHAEVNNDNATISIRFHAEAKNVSIQIYGTKTLLLHEEKIRLINGSFSKGESVQYVAHFPSGSKSGRFAVHINAEFSQKMQSKTCSFALTSDSLEEDEDFLDALKQVKVDQTGRMLKIISIARREN